MASSSFEKFESGNLKPGSNEEELIMTNDDGSYSKMWKFLKWIGVMISLLLKLLFINMNLGEGLSKLSLAPNEQNLKNDKFSWWGCQNLTFETFFWSLFQYSYRREISWQRYTSRSKTVWIHWLIIGVLLLSPLAFGAQCNSTTDETTPTPLPTTVMQVDHK